MVSHWHLVINRKPLICCFSPKKVICHLAKKSKEVLRKIFHQMKCNFTLKRSEK
jgi:hypothetical protein